MSIFILWSILGLIFIYPKLRNVYLKNNFKQHIAVVDYVSVTYRTGGGANRYSAQINVDGKRKTLPLEHYPDRKISTGDTLSVWSRPGSGIFFLEAGSGIISIPRGYYFNIYLLMLIIFAPLLFYLVVIKLFE